MAETELISGVLSPVITPFNGSQSLELTKLLMAIGFKAYYISLLMIRARTEITARRGRGLRLTQVHADAAE